MNNTIKATFIAISLATAHLANASPFGMGKINNCSGVSDGSPLTIACAGLELSEDGCPEGYTPEDNLCIADDLYAKHQVVTRSICKEGFEMVGKRCVREDIGESPADE